MSLHQGGRNSTMWNTTDGYEGIGSGIVPPCSNSLEGMNELGVAISYFIVFFLSLLGNAVVIFVVCTMQTHRTSTDIYLMHLALADLLFSLTLPFWAVNIYKSKWVFGTALCKLIPGIQEATFYGCVFLLACISIDRYVAIVRATQFLSNQRFTVILACVLVWLVAIMLCIPTMAQREVLQLASYSAMPQCYDNITADMMDGWRTGLRVLRHILGFFFPLAIMVVCYGSTVRTLFRSRNKQKQKAMRVILCVVLAFVICWLPNNMAMLIDTLMRGQLIEETCERRENLDVTMYITQVLAFSHCAINPILYAFVGKKFRNHLLILLSKKGLVRGQALFRHRTGSVYSSGSSRHTSVTL